MQKSTLSARVVQECGRSSKNSDFTELLEFMVQAFLVVTVLLYKAPTFIVDDGKTNSVIWLDAWFE